MLLDETPDNILSVKLYIINLTKLKPLMPPLDLLLIEVVVCCHRHPATSLVHSVDK